MGDIVIRAEGLSKQYRIGRKLDRYKTLRDTLAKTFVSSFRRTVKLLLSQATWPAELDERIWALKDVSFEIKRGDIVGIIGYNGAGKSTLLKILSRITEPTTGFADIYGRVGSLLEVGTGFHPELTGRENVYLNGAILGMKKREIDGKFDEIVAFAELVKFIDTPVKRYSSGMFVRLAFAVAAHLEPDILLVDEVLAVGDASFQKKCLGKMGNMVKQGRTVLVVSHTMGTISSLCNEVLWIKEGRMHQKGDPTEIIGRYLMQGSAFQGQVDLTSFVNRIGSGLARIQRATTKNCRGAITNQFRMGDDLIIEFDVCSKELLRRIALSIDVKTSTGIPVLHLVDRDGGFTVNELHGNKRIRVTIPKIPLYPGSYLLSFWIGNSISYDGEYDYVLDCLSIDVSEGDLLKRSYLSWENAIFTCQSWWNEVSGERSDAS